jgi:ribulose-5-phosphate 4-epimerase/fuculose-1-phosphate aldolase
MTQALEKADITTLPLEQAERALRLQLAAAYRMVDHFGWTELIYGHLTVRVPGDEPHFLINPYGLNYDEVTASNLVKIDIDGNIIGDSDYPVNRAGFVIHSAVHMANSAVHKCVMHTHTRAGMAVAALKDGLLPVSMTSTGFYDRISYHDYEGPSLDLDERERLLANLGDNRAMILRNHGLLVTGRDAAAAGTLNVITDNVAQVSREGIDAFSELESDHGVGAVEFAALMRKIDKVDPTYRQ